MARPSNTFDSSSLTIAVTPQVRQYLEDLTLKGTFGGSPAVWNTCMAFFQAQPQLDPVWKLAIVTGLLMLASVLLASFAPRAQAQLGALALSFGFQLLPAHTCRHRLHRGTHIRQAINGDHTYGQEEEKMAIDRVSSSSRAEVAIQ